MCVCVCAHPNRIELYTILCVSAVGTIPARSRRTIIFQCVYFMGKILSAGASGGGTALLSGVCVCMRVSVCLSVCMCVCACV